MLDTKSSHHEDITNHDDLVPAVGDSLPPASKRATLKAEQMSHAPRRPKERDATINTLDYSIKPSYGINDISFCRIFNDSLKFHKIKLIHSMEKPVGDQSDGELPKGKPPETTRHVWFQQSNNGIKTTILGPLLKPSSEMSKDEKEAIWWQQSDFHVFAKDIASICCHRGWLSENASGSYTSTLRKVYKKCSSRTPFVGDDYRSVLSDREMQELVLWIRVTTSRRGLERISIPFLVEARRRGRDQAVRSVIEHQKRVGFVFNSDSKCDSLRTFLEKRTQPAKIFARLLAEADAAVCGDSL